MKDDLLKKNMELKNFKDSLEKIQATTSEIFFWLLIAQWLLAISLALLISPYEWSGNTQYIHNHVWIAVMFGGVINALPLVLLRKRPTWWVTHHVVAAVQILWSAVLIHVTGGRIETHFHIFGSLAFLAFYRDWRLLITATVVVAVDHLTRGLLWPESIYGIANPEWWRFLEHAAWVLFEDIVLILGCLRATMDMKQVANRKADLELLYADIERQVHNRTQELIVTNKALESEMKMRLHAETELLHAQKLEALGRLAAGVAHEINTPIQFVGDSIQFVRDAANDMFEVIDKLNVVQRSVLDGAPSREAAMVAEETAEDADLLYLHEHIPKALDRAIDGLGRVATIVRSMKEFAHPGSKEMSITDLNKAIESTLTIARNEYKYVAELETDLGELPHVLCYVGEFNQVILNIVINAAHAITDVVKGTDRKGLIRIETFQDAEDVVVTICDTGGGIPESVQKQIFDPFFTTKEVGKGTGQGLAIARSVIEKHGGHLTFETQQGEGTTFFLRVPINGPAQPAQPAQEVLGGVVV